MTYTDDQVRLAALHKHWVTADSIDHHLRRSLNVPESFPVELPEATAELSILMSLWAALTVWYSLLYVIVEGYQELKLHDDEIANLLSDEGKVNLLRLFRNATFHYQEEPLSPKMRGFIEAEGGSKWIHALNRAFRAFFEREVVTNPVFKKAMDAVLKDWEPKS